MASNSTDKKDSKKIVILITISILILFVALLLSYIFDLNLINGSLPSLITAAGVCIPIIAALLLYRKNLMQRKSKFSILPMLIVVIILLVFLCLLFISMFGILN